MMKASHKLESNVCVLSFVEALKVTRGCGPLKIPNYT
jgi:hypothetical protein